MRCLLTAVAIAILAGCSKPAPAPARPATTTTAPEKTVTISPEVQALLKPDPDLDRKISPGEVKATLAAAQGQNPPATAAPLAPPGEKSDWKKAEESADAKRAAYEARLRATTVYLGSDGMYHTSNCPSLYVRQYDTNGFLQRVDFIGQASNLLHARDAQLRAHAQCGPPSYDFSYAQ